MMTAKKSINRANEERSNMANIFGYKIDDKKLALFFVFVGFLIIYAGIIGKSFCFANYCIFPLGLVIIGLLVLFIASQNV